MDKGERREWERIIARGVWHGLVWFIPVFLLLAALVAVALLVILVL